MTTRLLPQNWSVSQKKAVTFGLTPSPFVTRPHIDGISRAEETGRGNGLATSLGAPMLSTVRPVEAPDEPLIPIRQLATTSANYLPSTHPLTLSDKQTAKRLGTF